MLETQNDRAASVSNFMLFYIIYEKKIQTRKSNSLSFKSPIIGARVSARGF